MVLAVAAALSLVACGSSKKKESTSATTAPPQPSEVAITANEYSFGLPPTIPAGAVQLKLTNAGKEPHDLQLATVDGTHTKDEIVKNLASENEPISTWLHAAGGVGTTKGGGAQAAYVTLKPNTTYWYFCTETTKDNKAHSELGMIGTFTTGATGGVAAMPTATATVKAHEYGFGITGIKAGEQLVEFTNTGPNQIHHFVAAPIVAGKTFDEAKKALATPPNQTTEPPPVDFDKAVAVAALDPGQSEVMRLTFAPGDYVFVCFLRDHTPGPPHVAKGMVAEFKVA
jgi:hypothetical protein